MQLEYNEIRNQVEFEHTEGATLKPGILHRMSLGCAIRMWSQLSGMNIMMCVFFIFLDQI